MYTPWKYLIHQFPFVICKKNGSISTKLTIYQLFMHWPLNLQTVQNSRVIFLKHNQIIWCVLTWRFWFFFCWKLWFDFKGDRIFFGSYSHKHYNWVILVLQFQQNSSDFRLIRNVGGFVFLYLLVQTWNWKLKQVEIKCSRYQDLLREKGTQLKNYIIASWNWFCFVKKKTTIQIKVFEDFLILGIFQYMKKFSTIKNSQLNTVIYHKDLLLKLNPKLFVISYIPENTWNAIKSYLWEPTLRIQILLPSASQKFQTAHF